MHITTSAFGCEQRRKNIILRFGKYCNFYLQGDCLMSGSSRKLFVGPTVGGEFFGCGDLWRPLFRSEAEVVRGISPGNQGTRYILAHKPISFEVGTISE